MTDPPEKTIYEKAFAKSDKTDAILVVEGKKLHVNKEVLSYHSEYLNKLFNSEFEEKSMKEIQIKDVNFENFATVLSLVHGAPIEYTDCQVETLLEIALLFKLQGAKRHLELFVLSDAMLNYRGPPDRALQVADKFESPDLIFQASLLFHNYHDTLDFCEEQKNLEILSDQAVDLMFQRILTLHRELTGIYTPKQSEKYQFSIYESTFAKSDKTDAILVVQGKKLHVNKAFFIPDLDKVCSTSSPTVRIPKECKLPAKASEVQPLCTYCAPIRATCNTYYFPMRKWIGKRLKIEDKAEEFQFNFDLFLPATILFHGLPEDKLNNNVKEFFELFL